MTQALDDAVGLRRANVELQEKLDRQAVERDEALEQQLATAEILQIINASPGDLAPVFEALLETGARLCRAEQAVITLRDPQDGRYYYGTSFGYGADFKELLVRNPVTPGRSSLIGRTALEGGVVHIEDAATDLEYQWGEALRLGRWHTGLGVPLLREGLVVGILALTRRRIERFTDKQIEFIKTFADQAVIAIGNARLLDELRESNQRHGLVSQAVAEGIYQWDIEGNSLWVSQRLTEIFGFEDSALTATDWNRLVHPHDFDRYRTALRDCFRGLTARLACEYRVRHNDGAYRWVEDRGVPVRNADGRAVRFVGAVSDITQRKESDQALREALDQQTATAEILAVISNSLTDTQPVFEAIVQSGLKLFPDAAISVALSVEDQVHAVAVAETDAARAEAWRRRFPFPLTREYMHSAAILDKQIIDIPDVRDAPIEFAAGRRNFLASGYRGITIVPMRRGEAAIGTLSVVRRAPGPLSAEQLAVLDTFANQAVIAIENARLIAETREALDQQTATAEVLQVINSSPGDLAPVFDAMLEKAMRLCEASFGFLMIYDGEYLRPAADRGHPPFAEWVRAQGPIKPEPGTTNARLLAGEAMVHIPDVTNDPDAPGSSSVRQAVIEIGGFRTMLSIALRKEGTGLLGVIHVYRQEVRPFTDKQIALLQNFAAQAVIAMENARLMTETREARDDAEGALRDLKAAQANLVQKEKMASLGQLTAGIAHEIKNPLNFVNNFADLSVELLGELKESPAIATLDEDKRGEIDETLDLLTSNLEKIAEHGRRADGIVKSMLEHSRGGTGERREVDLNGLIEEAVNLAYHGSRAHDQGFNITLERDFGQGITPIELVPQDITRVCLNLFGNGFYAANKRQMSESDTKFAPILRVTTRDVGDAVEIRIRDNGTGIPVEVKDKLFQPFFTTKPTGEGTGLGLSISYDIVTQQHGGTIAVDSRIGEFTEFTIRLPRASRPPPRGTAA